MIPPALSAHPQRGSWESPLSINGEGIGLRCPAVRATGVATRRARWCVVTRPWRIRNARSFVIDPQSGAGGLRVDDERTGIADPPRTGNNAPARASRCHTRRAHGRATQADALAVDRQGTFP